MRRILKTSAIFAMFGLALSTAAIRAQIANPTYAVLSLQAYRAYYPFYMLGEDLDELARFGVLTALLVVSAWALWAARAVGLGRYIDYSRHGETFSWPWRAVMALAVVVLGGLTQAGIVVSLGADLMSRMPGWPHLALLFLIAFGPALAMLVLDRRIPEHRGLIPSLVLLFITGLSASFFVVDVAGQVGGRDFLISPLVSTYYGPWGMLGWVTGLFGMLGTAVGLMLMGLTPREDAEPDCLSPIPRQRLLAVAGTGSLLGLGLLASYPLYLVPRYQIGQDLREVLDMRMQVVPGRTVVFLDSFSPPHTIEPFASWSTPDNLAKVRAWVVKAPMPSALARPAAQGLGDQALWQWRPDEAMDWLEVQRRGQLFSNLNRVFLQVLQSTKPSAAYSKHLEALTDADRFAWPGPGSRLEIAAQLRRYGRQDEAAGWLAEARELGSDSLPPAPASAPVGSLRGRLLLDGKPLAGVRVALFYGSSVQELLRRSDEHVQGEQQLMRREWRPTYYQYLDLFRLQDFYAVETTDASGQFLFDSVDGGLYRLAVRLPGKAFLKNGGGLVTLDDGGELELGDYDLRVGP